MNWAGRAAANLLPLSEEGSDLANALREWRYTGNFHDLEEPVETCQLCDHPDIRYQFEIRNLKTGHELLIGSECINRFGIAATDEEGRALDAAGTRRKVERDRRKLIEDARSRRVITALVALAHAETDFDIQSFIVYLRTRGAFTPSQLVLVLWRLRTRGIVHRPGDFKLTVKRNREKAQLQNLKDWQRELISPALTPAQREIMARKPKSTTWDWE